MNIKDMSDAELNEACARIVGYTIVFNPNKTHWGINAPDGTRYAATATHISEPTCPDYCTSPDAQAELKKWLTKHPEVTDISYHWIGTIVKEDGSEVPYHEWTIEYKDNYIIRNSGDSGSEGRTLAETVYEAFREEKE